MGGFNLLLKLSLLLVLVSETGKIVEGTVNPLTTICSKIECPNFDVINVGDGYEIRRYNSAVWMTTSPIMDISLVDATRTGFLQ